MGRALGHWALVGRKIRTHDERTNGWMWGAMRQATLLVGLLRVPRPTEMFLLL